MAECHDIKTKQINWNSLRANLPNLQANPKRWERKQKQTADGKFQVQEWKSAEFEQILALLSLL